MLQTFILTCLSILTGVISSPYSLPDNPYNSGCPFDSNSHPTSKGGTKKATCNTQECKLIAKMFKKTMNVTANPCDDFFTYACGNWENNVVHSKDAASWNLAARHEKNIAKQIERLLKFQSKSNVSIPMKLAKKWYKACTNEERMEEKGLEPLISTLWRFGGWPLIMEDGEWNDRTHKWQTVDDHYARLTGFNAFYNIRVGRRDWDDMDRALIINLPELPYQFSKSLMENEAPDYDFFYDDDSNEEEEQEQENEEYYVDEMEDENDDSINKLNDESTNVKDDNNSNKNEDEDEDEIRLKEVTKRKRKFAHYETKFKTGKAIRKQSDEKKLRQRVKERAILKNEINRRHKKTKVSKHVDPNITKTRINTPRVNKSVHTNNPEEFTKMDRSKEDDNESDDTNESNDNTDDDEENGNNQDVAINAKKYSKYILNVALELAKAREVKVPMVKLKKDVLNLVQFQLKLSKIVKQKKVLMQTTLYTLQKKYMHLEPTTDNGKINWFKKVESLLTEAGVEFADYLETRVLCYKYLKDLRSLLDETSSETIVNYVHWNFLSRTIMATTKKMRDLYNDWNNIDNNDEDRSEKCREELKASDFIVYEYAKTYYTDDLAKTATDMIEDIQKEVAYQVKESPWMNPKTKHFILAKLGDMKKILGYPEWYRNNTMVKRYFQGLSFGPSYLENILNFWRHRKWKGLQKLRLEDYLILSYADSRSSSAFFYALKNFFIMTAAEFQSPQFDYRRPMSINFAIIGFIIAHEINHAFDDDGHLYDRKGTYTDWLPAMADEYNKRVDCFVDQFNNYSVFETRNLTIKNYGTKTLSENIADTMGLLSAYRAYRRRERECEKPNAALPGFEKFTNDQIFFLAYASPWCDTRDADLEYIQRETHTTGRLRIIGTLSNSEDFAEAFYCPLGSRMNPEKKCNIWQ